MQQGNTFFHLVHKRIAWRIATVAGSALLCSMTWGAAQAQSTNGMIHGQAPAGDVVVVHSTSGFRHHATVGANGQYKLRNLPLGIYSVKLKDHDKIVDMYHRVPLMVSRGVEVNFACPHDKCAAPGNDERSS